MPDREAGLRLDCTTALGRRWSTTELAPSASRVLDEEHLLAVGDLITVLSPRTRRRLGVLEVRAQEGRFALLRHLRDG